MDVAPNGHYRLNIARSQMPIQHVVAFQYKAGTPAERMAEVARAFLALKDECRRPSSGAYIVRLQGGRQDSPEGQDRSMQHVYLVEFENEDDRQHYLSSDPAHEAFKALVGPLVESAIVLDFTAGAW